MIYGGTDDQREIERTARWAREAEWHPYWVGFFSVTLVDGRKAKWEMVERRIVWSDIVHRWLTYYREKPKISASAMSAN